MKQFNELKSIISIDGQYTISVRSDDGTTISCVVDPSLLFPLRDYVLQHDHVVHRRFRMTGTASVYFVDGNDIAGVAFNASGDGSVISLARASDEAWYVLIAGAGSNWTAVNREQVLDIIGHENSHKVGGGASYCFDVPNSIATLLEERPEPPVVAPDDLPAPPERKTTRSAYQIFDHIEYGIGFFDKDGNVVEEWEYGPDKAKRDDVVAQLGDDDDLWPDGSVRLEEQFWSCYRDAIYGVDYGPGHVKARFGGGYVPRSAYQFSSSR